MSVEILLTIPGRGDLTADVTAATIATFGDAGLDLSTVYTAEQLAEVLGYITTGDVTITVRTFYPRESSLVESFRVFEVWLEVEGAAVVPSMGPSRRTFQRGR